MRGLLFSFILTCLGSTVALTIDLDEFRSTFVQDPEVINTEELVVTVTPGTTEDELKSILAETNDFVVAEKVLHLNFVISLMLYFEVNSAFSTRKYCKDKVNFIV